MTREQALKYLKNYAKEHGEIPNYETAEAALEADPELGPAVDWLVLALLENDTEFLAELESYLKTLVSEEEASTGTGG